MNVLGKMFNYRIEQFKGIKLTHIFTILEGSLVH